MKFSKGQKVTYLGQEGTITATGTSLYTGKNFYSVKYRSYRDNKLTKVSNVIEGAIKAV